MSGQATEGPARKPLAAALAEEGGSPLRKYQDLYVGRRSLPALIGYELRTLSAVVPGAPGFLLRKLFCRSLFARAGRGLLIGRQVELRCPGRISIGDNAVLDGGSVLDAKGAGSKIRIGDALLLGRNSILSCSEATIDLGDDVSIGPHCFIRAGLAPVTIGSAVTIGANCSVVSGAPGYARTDVPMKHQIGRTDGVTVGDDVWLGVGVSVVDGARIGSGAVIGAGAVVIDTIPERAIAVGVPARPIGYRGD